MKDKPQYKIEYYADTNKYYVVEKRSTRVPVSSKKWYGLDTWETLWYYRKIVIHPEDLVLDNTGPYTLAYDSIDEAIIVCERMKEGNTSYYPPDYEPVKENQ